MSNYIIGIGGSGQRVVRALLHLENANAMEPDGIGVLVVDKDVPAGNGVSNLLERYQQGREDTPLARRAVVNYGFWDPEPAQRISRFGELARTRDDELAMRALFTRHEREELGKNANGVGGFAEGFKGHPNVGAVYQHSALGGGGRGTAIDKLLGAIEADVKGGGSVRVCLAGSLFGGTGASGLPLIVQKLRERFGARVRIGAVLLLPYFQYTPPEGAQRDNIKLSMANLQTGEALKFYANNGYTDPDNPERFIDDSYMLGLSNQARVGPYCEGGEGQNNRPVFIEITAARAIAHFFALPERPKRCDAWVVAVDPQESGGQDALDGGAFGGAPVLAALDRAIRYALYAQLFVYWGLLASREEGVEFLPDKNALEWLKPSGLRAMAREGGHGGERAASVALKAALDAHWLRCAEFIRWALDALSFEPIDAGERAYVFERFGPDKLAALRAVFEEMDMAFRRDPSLPAARRPRRKRALIGGAQGSPVQAQWREALDGIYRNTGADSYGARVVRAMKAGAPDCAHLRQILNIVYDQCV